MSFIGSCSGDPARGRVDLARWEHAQSAARSEGQFGSSLVHAEREGRVDRNSTIGTDRRPICALNARPFPLSCALMPRRERLRCEGGLRCPRL